MASMRPPFGDGTKDSSLPVASDAGIEMEAALPRTLPLAPTAHHVGPSLDEPEGSFLPTPPAPEAADTAAPFLTGLPAEEVAAIDASFQRLLTVVHANRPGDDLE